MRADRLLALLLRLQARGKMTARALAAELGVSVRTIYRDLDALGAAGVPVVAVGGPGGGCMLLDGYRSPLLGLNPAEATALLAASVAGPSLLAGGGRSAPGGAEPAAMESALADARRKLVAGLPERHRAGAAAVAGRFHLDPAAWFCPAEAVPHLAVLVDGVRLGRRLRIEHRGTRRVVDPLGLVAKAAAYYLVAAGPGGVVAHRAARISAAELLDEPFEPPAGFDLAAFWARWTAEFEARFGGLTVTVRLSPDGVRAATEVLGAPLPEAGPGDGDDGGRTVRLRFDSVAAARRRLLGFGADAEVLEPIELRAEVAEAARRTAARYERPAPGWAPGAGQGGRVRLGRVRSGGSSPG
ncbi:helix-turn-helix transcriptional regulator [Dactylosporangium sp. CA-092794]|uniref:helix-turn-helix transcriptional regulator n=1 Tax=Dactylosporangium sp. CA-092794 TaxID=3239929 RepID=UPI003D8A8809